MLRSCFHLFSYAEDHGFLRWLYPGQSEGQVFACAKMNAQDERERIVAQRGGLLRGNSAQVTKKPRAPVLSPSTSSNPLRINSVEGLARGASFLILYFAFLSLLPSVVSAEEMTITTYYPSPNGAYDALNVKRLSVGDTNGDGSINASDVSASSGYLLVADKIGVGTRSPSSGLSFGGRNLIIFNKDTGTETNGNVIGGMGFIGYGVSHGQFDYRAGTGFEMLNVSNDGPSITHAATAFAPLYLSSLHATAAIHLDSASVNTGNTSFIISNASSGGETYALTSGIPNVTQAGFSINKLTGYTYGASIQTISAPQLVINTNGNVGIGTASPESTLTLYNATAHDYLRIKAPLAYQSSIAFNDDTNGQDIVTYRPGSTRDYRIWTATTGDTVTVTQAGNVGIGTTSPAGKLDINAVDAVWILGYSTLSHISNGSTFLKASSGNYICFQIPNGTNVATINSSGTYSVSSDQRLKMNIQPLDQDNGLAAVKRLNPVTFNWKSVDVTRSNQMGFVAQDIQKVFPQLVTDMGAVTIKLADGTTQTVSDAKGISYEGLIAPMVKAIQEQQKQIEELRGEIRELRIKSNLRGR